MIAPVAPLFWTARRVRLMAFGMLSIHTFLAINSLLRENPTVDEVMNLPAGITYWQTGQFKLYHQNPPLLKLVAAIPVVLSAPVMEPLYRSPSWTGYIASRGGMALEFASRNAKQYFELFARARLMMPLFSVLGGVVVFAWSRRLFGCAGGLLSLALWCFCPNILAHARLITTDVGATALGIGATYVFWRYLEQPSWRRAAFAGLALGVAELAKFSMLLLYAIWPFLWLVRVLCTWPRAGIAKRLARAVAQGLAIVALSVLTINAGYGFEGVGDPLGRFEFVCRLLTRPVPPGTPRPKIDVTNHDLAWKHRVNRFRGTALESFPVPLPRHYVLGFDDQKYEAEGMPKSWIDPNWAGDPNEVQGYPVYLDGDVRRTGWWYYYPCALAYKVPEGSLALVGLSIAVLALFPRTRLALPDEAVIWTAPMAILGVMSFGTDLNLGLRYVLPMFPYLFISAGRLAPWAAGFASAAKRGAASMFIAVCLGATILATLLIHPSYLAYFNWRSGGPDHGSDHLIDSNLDWGQDLVGLREWLRTNAPGEPVGLAYFGTINPGIFAMRGDPFPWYLAPARPGTMASPAPSHLHGNLGDRLHPGLYAVSATLVRGRPWRVFDPAYWIYLSARKNAFSYFQGLTPIDNVGHSIFIYRVTPEQAARLDYIWADAKQDDRRGDPEN